MNRNQIPVIDLDEQANPRTGTNIVQAVSRWGFVFVKGKSMGFSPSFLNRTFELVHGHGLDNPLRPPSPMLTANSHESFSILPVPKKRNVQSPQM